MALGYYLLLLVLSSGQAQAQAPSTQPDLEELKTIGWQLAYERWQRQCEMYNLPAQQQEAAVSTRIAGGQIAEEGMFPYQAALLMALRQGDYRQCGGSLISLEFVLTAAHCLIDATSGKVYLGSNKYAVATAANVFELQQQDFNVYPGYLGFGGYNDLALMRLPRPATPTAAVQTIALAQPFMQQSLLEGQLVSTSGWGALGDNLSESPSRRAEEDLLHYVDVPVLEQALCICYFLPGLVSVRRHICTDGREGRGGCEGDSGGPLVYQWRNVTYLIGLTTFGSATGCELGAPTVYTRITAYSEWILGITGL